VTLREIMSGQQRGLFAFGARGLLAGAEAVYGSVVSLRNRQYDRGGKAVHRVGVPVISVGNITAGGTGKTPFVAWIANWFEQRSTNVALVSRGYGARANGKNDEALELELRLPRVPHVQNADRVAAARQAISGFETQLVVLDDAFQHRRIYRDLDIVLIDALEPFGYGHLLPRGLLREPLSSLRRAHLIALSRADLVTANQRAEIRATVRRHAPNATWIEVAHRPRRLVSETNARLGSSEISSENSIDTLRGLRIAAFCGIGNPLGFRRTLENSGVIVCAFREFPDHHLYSRDDTSSLATWLDTMDIDLALCTMKDLVKLRVDQIGRHPLRALMIDVEILAGREELESQLSALSSREREK